MGGFYFRSGKNTRLSGITATGGGAGIVADLDPSAPGDGLPTVFSTNVLVLNQTEVGFNMSSQSDWLHDHPNAFEARSIAYAVDGAASEDGYEHATTVDPMLEGCVVFIPDDSPLKGAGTDG